MIDSLDSNQTKPIRELTNKKATERTPILENDNYALQLVAENKPNRR